MVTSRMVTGLETVIQGDAEATLLRYQFLLDTEGIAILTLDDEGTITTMSPSIQGMTGHLPQDLIGIKLDDLVLETARDTFRKKHTGG